MLVGYVSDEWYVSLPDVLLELERQGRSVEARSRATGAVYADLLPGQYQVTLYREGYGSKRSTIHLPEQAPYSCSVLARLVRGRYHFWKQPGEP